MSPSDVLPSSCLTKFLHLFSPLRASCPPDFILVVLISWNNSDEHYGHAASHYAVRSCNISLCITVMQHLIMQYGHATSHYALRSCNISLCITVMQHLIMHYGHAAAHYALPSCSISLCITVMQHLIMDYGHAASR